MRGHPGGHAGDQGADPHPAREPGPRCPVGRRHHVRHARDGRAPSDSAQDAAPRRLLLISSILISLKNKAFLASYTKHKTPAQLATNLVKTVIDELKASDVP